MVDGAGQLPDMEVPVVRITEDAVRKLAGFRGSKDPVTSCYVDVDGRRFLRHADVEQHLERMVKQAKYSQNGNTSCHRDLVRIEQHVKAGFDRKGVRGLALFSCMAQGLWEVFELPFSVRDQIVIDATPHVRSVNMAATNGSANQVGWKFTDEQGHDWSGDATVESSDQRGKFLLTVKLARQSG